LSRFAVGDLVSMRPSWVRRFGKKDIRVEKGTLGVIVSKGIDRFHLVRVLARDAFTANFANRQMDILSSCQPESLEDEESPTKRDKD